MKRGVLLVPSQGSSAGPGAEGEFGITISRLERVVRAVSCGQVGLCSEHLAC